MAEIIEHTSQHGVLITSFVDQFGNLWMSTDEIKGLSLIHI